MSNIIASSLRFTSTWLSIVSPCPDGLYVSFCVSYECTQQTWRRLFLMLAKHIVFINNTFGMMWSFSEPALVSARIRLLAAVIMYSWVFSVHVIKSEAGILYSLQELFVINFRLKGIVWTRNWSEYLWSPQPPQNTSYGLQCWEPGQKTVHKSKLQRSLSKRPAIKVDQSRPDISHM